MKKTVNVNGQKQVVNIEMKDMLLTRLTEWVVWLQDTIALLTEKLLARIKKLSKKYFLNNKGGITTPIITNFKNKIK